MLLNAVYILNLRFMPVSIIYGIIVIYGKMLTIDAKYYLMHIYGIKVLFLQYYAKCSFYAGFLYIKIIIGTISFILFYFVLA